MSVYLEITLVSVEDNGFVGVEFPHHFHGEARNGRLEVRLFSIHHQTDILLSSILKTHNKSTNLLKQTTKPNLPNTVQIICPKPVHGIQSTFNITDITTDISI